MGRTAIIVQKFYRDDNINKPVEMCYGFYSQFGYGHLLFRDIAYLLRFVGIDSNSHDFLMVKDNGYGIESVSNCEIEPETYKFTPNKNLYSAYRIYKRAKVKKVSTKPLVERLQKHFHSFLDFSENMSFGGSLPYLQQFQVNIGVDNLMADFRTDKEAFEHYFGQFDNDDGGALITIRKDDIEIRIFGNDGKFISPKEYIKQYMKGVDCGTAFRVKDTYKAYTEVIKNVYKGRIYG